MNVVEQLRHDQRLRSLPLVVNAGRELDEIDWLRLRLDETRFVINGREHWPISYAKVIGLFAPPHHACVRGCVTS